MANLTARYWFRNYDHPLTYQWFWKGKHVIVLRILDLLWPWLSLHLLHYQTLGFQFCFIKILFKIPTSKFIDSIIPVGIIFLNCSQKRQHRKSASSHRFLTACLAGYLCKLKVTSPTACIVLFNPQKSQITLNFFLYFNWSNTVYILLILFGNVNYSTFIELKEQSMTVK